MLQLFPSQKTYIVPGSTLWNYNTLSTCKQHLMLCKNILGLYKGAVSQQKFLSPPHVFDTAQRGYTQHTLSSGINWDILLKFLRCKLFYRFDNCWKMRAIHSNKAITPSITCSVIRYDHPMISLIISTEPHNTVWNHSINRDLGPACSQPLILGVPIKVPEQLKSELHFSIGTHFLAVVPEFMAM